MIKPHRNFVAVVSGRPRRLVEPLHFYKIERHGGRCVAVPGIVEDDFGTAADPRRALATDRRFVSTNDDHGHAGRAA